MDRVRRNVARITRDGDWPETLVAYERAVGLMRAADPGPGRPTEPTGWRYQAAIHGLAGPDGRPDTSDPIWSSCQHGSWFFLPWHRMYLAAFERIVQHHLGDDGWSLPYWYAIDPERPRRGVLPAAFRENRSDNDLFTTQRSRRANRGKPFYGVFPFEQLSTGLGDALAAGRYATADGIATFGGGKRARPTFNGPEQGLLEGTPHGLVHVLVGNDLDRAGNTTRQGWMGSFVTAALDPIFWLHHANLDRLWQVWMGLGHSVPRQRAWLDTSFTFPAPGGASVTWSVAEVLETDNLGYRYDDVDPPAGVAAALKRPVRPREEDEEPKAPTPQREVLRLRHQATPPSEETDLTAPPRVLGAVSDVAMSTTAQVDIPLTSTGGAGRTYLRVEGVTGSAGAAAYVLYLDVAPGEPPARHPELRVGILSTFGVAEASVPGELHDGDGVTATYDVTVTRTLLEAEGRWDDVARVSVVTAQPEPDEDDPEGGSDVAPPSDVRARRVAVLVAGL